MGLDILEKLPESGRHGESDLPVRLPAGPVYKLPGGMIEQVRSVVPATRYRPACEEDVSIDR